ncbi:DUF1707 domain-containing protein [Herbidospora sp. NEAU-GS84]|uniref:DUF1707 domain-containing protein n=1 Tax=Herbidospora solisilvae TaxID=2696284 RepID=A0A7C9J0K3_9ACTN|nr:MULTISPECIES: DUF1707 domain-containing protein [Herbidospora]NAS20962.1 DUF1707 domain-containing protein [Herbidospora solisilvae]GLX93011.1 hypothetical protein Hesp01_09610 [Herbidospora sp. NBRC 101105]
MADRRDVRVSDGDREAAVAHLLAAVDEGRLSLDEYNDRMSRAYASVTFGDLDKLFVDLPSAPATTPTVTATQTKAPVVATGALPRWLKVVWIAWAAKVALNLVIWVLLSFTERELIYFWPMWVIIPPGLVLLAVSYAVTASKRSARS